jgi:hypothetical protein
MTAAVDVMMADGAASVLSSHVARVAGCTVLVPVLVLLLLSESRGLPRSVAQFIRSELHSGNASSSGVPVTLL